MIIKSPGLPGVLSGRFLPLSSGPSLPPPFPNALGAGALGHSSPCSAPLGPVVVTSRRWAGWARAPGFPHPRVTSEPSLQLAAPALSPAGRRCDLPPLPPAAAVAPHAFLRVEQQLSLRRRLGRGQAGPLARGPSRGAVRVASVGLLRDAERSVSGTCWAPTSPSCAAPGPESSTPEASQSPGSQDWRGGGGGGTGQDRCKLSARRARYCLRNKWLRGPDPGLDG